jgi:urease accessory protein
MSTTTIPTTTTASTAIEPAALLQLIWLASPALPVGGFSYSEGLEAAIDSGRVVNEASAAEWLAAQLQLALARSELPLLAAACEAWHRHDIARIVELNRWVGTTRESSEMRQQIEQMGRSMLEWLRQHDAAEPRLATLAALKPAPTWPLAFALAAAQSGAPAQASLLAFAFGWAENMVQAAIKAVPLGQTAGQRILARLAREIPAAVDAALQMGDDQRQAFAPMLAILSAQHETQYSRLFRS